MQALLWLAVQVEVEARAVARVRLVSGQVGCLRADALATL